MLSIAEQRHASILLSDAKPRRLQHLRMTLGDIIRAARKQAKLSQREVAKALGVSPGAVAQWELDQTAPTTFNMLALKALLNIENAKPAPGSPYSGEVVEDPDELALLRFWRSLDGPDRVSMAKLLNIGGSVKLAS